MLPLSTIYIFGTRATSCGVERLHMVGHVWSGAGNENEWWIH